MTEKKSVSSAGFSADWLFRGALSRIGDTLDKFTGRRWTPSSSLATSELIERVKRLLDSEAREIEGKGTVVPHNIQLKVQWDKFATDSDTILETLEHELLTAAADHINDNLYYTCHPLRVAVKPDYFTEGVKLFVSFEETFEGQHEAELNVTIPSLKIETGMIAENSSIPPKRTVIARFALAGSPRDRRIDLAESGRLSVGRTAISDLMIDDSSVSKLHAAVVVDPEGKLTVADTGSTNGTFINGERIPYGKAMDFNEGDRIRFGSIDVVFELVDPEPQSAQPVSFSQENTVKIDSIESSVPQSADTAGPVSFTNLADSDNDVPGRSNPEPGK